MKMYKNEALDLLGALAEEGRSLSHADTEGFTRFRQRGRMILRRIFGEDSDYVSSWNKTSFTPRQVSLTSDNSDRYRDAWVSGMEVCVARLETAMEELETFGARSPTPENASVAPRSDEGSKKVFVVHGHDEGMKETVARLLSRLGLEPIILHEQPNKGRTIIEKFEDYADVSFAVVLLTPDDMAYSVGHEPSEARPRARQNVILELGFFIAKLGRERVAALYAGEDDFEKPSDVDGVLYIPIDDHQWQLGLVRELKAAGIDVDANEIA